ncbi:MAG: hypothetical protein LBS63_02250 [Prevotellaceae bacterium]|jgi:hypothetical protein|nr:hypothetical protein [Prevotellaceae bacterium]
MHNNTNSDSAKIIERKKYLDEMKPLLEKEVKKDAEGKVIVVKFKSNANKHIYHDAGGRAKELHRDELKKLDIALDNAIFVKSAPLYKNRKDSITKFYYFKDSERELYYNVAEICDKGHYERFLYAVTNIIK